MNLYKNRSHTFERLIIMYQLRRKKNPRSIPDIKLPCYSCLLQHWRQPYNAGQSITPDESSNSKCAVTWQYRCIWQMSPCYNRQWHFGVAFSKPNEASTFDNLGRIFVDLIKIRAPNYSRAYVVFVRHRKQSVRLWTRRKITSASLLIRGD